MQCFTSTLNLQWRTILKFLTFAAVAKSASNENTLLPHAYNTSTGFESLWMHFDGLSASNFYNLISTQLGLVFTSSQAVNALRNLQKIYDIFDRGISFNEMLVSRYIYDMLTELMLTDNKARARSYDSVLDEIISYMQEHSAEELTVDFLAKKTMLSEYHFIRVFKAKTGFTPHAYLVSLRLSKAKYLLKTTDLLVKDICFSCGFSDESIFCAAFKKEFGMSPSEYRHG